MKINHERIRLAVRWQSSSAGLLRETVDHLCARRKDGSRWGSLCLDGRETSSSEPNALVKFYPFRLSSMRHFRVCHTNEGSWQILAGSGGEFSWDVLDSTVHRFRRLDINRMKSADLTYVVGRTEDSAPDDIGEFFIEFGWRTQSDPPGYVIRVHSSNPRSSVAARFAFIASAIEHLGLNDVVQVDGDEKEFTLRTGHGWSLYEFESWLNKRNPSFFRIGPFSSFDDVWQRAERFRASLLGRQINRFCVSFFLVPDVYESVYEQLNALANDWCLDLYGSYTDGIDPYTADRSRSPDGRFPVFVWRPLRDGGDLFYQADIVPTAEGRFLEIHSNCGDMKKLLKEAEAAAGMKFTPIDYV